jgi:hypothetical protein
LTWNGVVCLYLVSPVLQVAPYQSVRTRSTLAFPVSLIVKGNDSSSPEAGSVRVRNAWCGFRPFPPFVTVRSIFNVSLAPRLMALERGLDGVSLYENF